MKLLCITLLSCIECFVRCVDLPSIDILVLVPWPDPRQHAGWDVGLELLPAGRIAARTINNRTDLLRDYQINLIEAGHEACGLTENSLGLTNLVGKALSTGANVAAVLGLFCSTSTTALSPVAGHEGADLIQLSASYSPIFNKHSNRFPHLWRFVQSADVYADAILHLMEENNWSRIAVIANHDIVLYREIASHLVDKLVRSKNKTTVYNGELQNLFPEIQPQVLTDLKRTQARIVFLAAESNQIASLLCEAYENDMKYPNYLWVIVDWTLEDLYSTGVCNENKLKLVLEGSIYSYYHFALTSEVEFPDNGEKLIDAYLNELEKVKEDYHELIQETNVLVDENLYGSILYDQVWAFALALNSSLPELEAKNISITEYGFGHPDITYILEENLKTVSFQGANGRVEFNDRREVSRPIDLFQIINGTAILVGERIDFGTFTGEIGFNFSSSLDDEIPEFYQTVNCALKGIMIIMTITLFILVTVVLSLFIKYRNVQEIKANSVKVSMLMFFACYLFILEQVIIIIQSSVQLSHKSYSVLCNLHYFLFMNAPILLFATLYLKLERIHRIFYNESFKMYTWNYSNWMIASKAAGICLLGNVIFISIVATKPVNQMFFIDFQPYRSITAKFKYPYCHIQRPSNYLYYTFYLLLAVFMFLNVYLASRARKISKRGFKNTKLINIYMMLVFVVLSFVLPFNEIYFVNSKYVLYTSVVIFFCTFFIATFSQLMLFLPSVMHAVKVDKKHINWKH